MQWVDEAIVLSIKSFGEHSFIVTVFSKEHGLYKGLSKRKKVSIGDFVQVRWSARLPEHLGNWIFELKKSYSADAIRNRFKLQCLLVLCETLRGVLPERSECSNIFQKTIDLLDLFLEPSRVLLLKYFFFECFLLTHLGFALDFSDFVFSSEKDPLYFVSPKTGKVVTYSVGLPYYDRLLQFPQFLLIENVSEEKISDKELRIGFALTQHFLFNYIEKGETLEMMRQKMINEILH